jgi:hypothetical protein
MTGLRFGAIRSSLSEPTFGRARHSPLAKIMDLIAASVPGCVGGAGKAAEWPSHLRPKADVGAVWNVVVHAVEAEAEEMLNLLSWAPPVPAGRLIGAGDGRQAMWLALGTRASAPSRARACEVANLPPAS